MQYGKGYSALRKGRVYELGNIYHLVFSTREHDPYLYDFQTARLTINSLKYCDDNGWSETIAFVVMPDHIHWLTRAIVHPPNFLVSSVKRHVAKQSCFKVKWNKGFYDSLIRDEEQLINTARYIIANPKRAGLVESVKDFPHWDCVYL
ncbi:Transposase IS200 like protein [Marinomonas aquimarina]|uniref:Transposase IS200 like protein n=1 Tax=Marinomonas aquimarina TaxID=295068 RepID=A0A1A8TFL9_9GAMM|nr:transposase [Marinomonas aquimarina]SBS31336.1 Transposase IS200 like protein [Marinomonas aquimarina]